MSPRCREQTAVIERRHDERAAIQGFVEAAVTHVADSELPYIRVSWLKDQMGLQVMHMKPAS